MTGRMTTQRDGEIASCGPQLDQLMEHIPSDVKAKWPNSRAESGQEEQFWNTIGTLFKSTTCLLYHGIPQRRF